MKKALSAAAMVAYLSCAAPETIPSQAPVVVEISQNAIAEEILEEAEPVKQPPAETPAEFIVKTLEGMIKQNKEAKYAQGSVEIKAPPHSYTVEYNFDPSKFCDVRSGEFLSEGALSISFREQFSAYGDDTLTSITFVSVRPFHAAEGFNFYHQVESSSGTIASFQSMAGFYPFFPEAQKLQEELLRYVAKEVKRESASVSRFENVVIIHRPPVEGLNGREGNIINSYKEFSYVFSMHPPHQHGKLINPTLIERCKP